ncbi:MAG TPA: alpha/beta hydrolase [Acidimicrobiales bacterium]|nr:alpha/beta hydrolase [Acidimicrobiales bacterium]
MQPANRFLLSRLRGLATTVNAVRPAGKEPPLASYAFAVGLPTSELPLQVAALQIATAAYWAAKNGRSLRSAQGALGLALGAASLGGLWALHREAHRSADVLEAALVDALGPHYRDRITEPFTPQPDVPLTRRAVALPALTAGRRRYLSERDLAYGEFGVRNHLDIWKRKDLPADAAAPVLLQVHGGAWAMGEKRTQANPLMGHLAERGWVCVSINYRLSPRSTWPDHIVDVKRAIAWVRANIGRYGGDPSFLAISGGSAGGHLASLAALTPGLAAFQPGFEDADTSVTAAVPLYGVYDFLNRDGTSAKALGPFVARLLFKSQPDDDRETWEQASPLSHVGPHAPPFFVLHGTNDTIVPVGMARSFVARLRSSSPQPVVYAELPRAQHAFDVLPSVRAHRTVHAIERFLAVVRSERGGQTPAEAVESDRV